MANTRPIATRKSGIDANRDVVAGYLGVAGAAGGVGICRAGELFELPVGSTK
jgi:hypothetical protein